MLICLAIGYEPAVSQCEGTLGTLGIYMYVAKNAPGNCVYSIWNSLLWSWEPPPRSCRMDTFPLIHWPKCEYDKPHSSDSRIFHLHARMRLHGLVLSHFEFTVWFVIMRSEVEPDLIILWTNDAIRRICRSYVTNSSVWDNLNGVCDMEELDVDGKIILKLILKKWFGRV
jgi:hypothetical protein